MIQLSDELVLCLDRGQEETKVHLGWGAWCP